MADQQPTPPPEQQELSAGGGVIRSFAEFAQDMEAEEPTPEQIEENKVINALAEDRRQHATQGEIASQGVQLDAAALAQCLQAQQEPAIKKRKLNRGPVRRIFSNPLKPANNRGAKAFDLISSLSSCHEIIIEVCKHLPYKDILKLYSVSKTFHNIFDTYMLSSITQLAVHCSHDAFDLFHPDLYPKCSIRDPAGRSINPHSVIIPGTNNNIARVAPPAADAADARWVPNLRWLGLILSRERMLRDILACLARQGHRLPTTMAATLRKMWLAMDASTNETRGQIFHVRSFITDEDLFNMNMFFIKLNMRLSMPLYGRGSDGMLQMLLGQRTGLREIWRLLRGAGKGASAAHIMRMKVRYDFPRRPALINAGVAWFGVPVWDVGVQHLEGWGTGRVHLLRPDEFLTLEAANRGMRLDNHARFMMAWGYRDFQTGANVAPTQEEMYMSDEELPPAEGPYKGFGNVPFRAKEWQPHHAMKARWESLTLQQKLLVWAEQEDEKLRAEAFDESTEEWLNDEEQRAGALDSDDSDSDDEDDGDEAAMSNPYTGSKWNAINKAKVIDRMTYSRGTLRQKAQAVRRNQLSDHDRLKVTAMVRTLGRTASRSDRKLKNQAKKHYTDEEHQVWDDYLDSLGDEFWEDAHKQAGELAGTDAVLSSRARRAGKVLQPLHDGPAPDKDDQDDEMKDDDGGAAAEDEQLEDDEDDEDDEAIDQWEKDASVEPAAGAAPRKASWATQFEAMDLDDGDGEENVNGHLGGDEEDYDMVDEQDDESAEGSSDKENKWPDGGEADDADDEDEGVEDILGQLRVLRANEAYRLSLLNAGGPSRVADGNVEAERRKLMKKLEEKATRDVFSWNFRGY